VARNVTHGTTRSCDCILFKNWSIIVLVLCTDHLLSFCLYTYVCVWM
jgi:hypothetical protein